MYISAIGFRLVSPAVTGIRIGDGAQSLGTFYIYTTCIIVTAHGLSQIITQKGDEKGRTWMRGIDETHGRKVLVHDHKGSKGSREERNGSISTGAKQRQPSEVCSTPSFPPSPRPG